MLYCAGRRGGEGQHLPTRLARQDSKDLYVSCCEQQASASSGLCRVWRKSQNLVNKLMAKGCQLDVIMPRLLVLCSWQSRLRRCVLSSSAAATGTAKPSTTLHGIRLSSSTAASFVQLAEQIEALDPQQQCSDYWLGKADREAAAAGLPPAERGPRNPLRPSGGSARPPTVKRSKRNR